MLCRRTLAVVPTGGRRSDDENDGYTVPESLRPGMNGRRAWVSVDGEPRLGTVVRYSYAPKTGAPILAVELDDPVGDTDEVVVNPQIDDVLFDSDA